MEKYKMFRTTTFPLFHLRVTLRRRHPSWVWSVTDAGKPNRRILYVAATLGDRIQQFGLAPTCVWAKAEQPPVCQVKPIPWPRKGHNSTMHDNALGLRTAIAEGCRRQVKSVGGGAPTI